jgi:hypothetical protein
MFRSLGGGQLQGIGLGGGGIPNTIEEVASRDDGIHHGEVDVHEREDHRSDVFFFGEAPDVPSSSWS